MRVADAPSAPNKGLKSQTGKSGDGATAKATASGGGTAATYGVLVVPFYMATDDSLNNGCWARIYESPNFGGAHLTLVGPVEMTSLDGTFADDWNGADSIVTGRGATVTAYDDRGFRNRTLTVGPAQSSANMTAPFEKIESLKVACQGRGPAVG